MRRSSLFVAIATLLAVGEVDHQGVKLAAREAHAVIGRPLTPMSYAGVARRTARRTTRRNVYAGGYGYGYGGAHAAGVVTTLPAGCGFGAGIYTCGAVRYRPYYDGPTVVYHVVQ
jgi:hypothetical protein